MTDKEPPFWSCFVPIEWCHHRALRPPPRARAMATATRPSGWRIVRGGDAERNPRVLDADETGGAVAETLAALTMAQAQRCAPPDAAAAAADEMRYSEPRAAAPEAKLRAALGETPPEEEEEGARIGLAMRDEAQPVAAADLPAEERVASLHPPPAADTPEARPADRVPPVCVQSPAFCPPMWVPTS